MKLKIKIGDLEINWLGIIGIGLMVFGVIWEILTSRGEAVLPSLFGCVFFLTSILWTMNNSLTKNLVDNNHLLKEILKEIKNLSTEIKTLVKR